VPKYAASVPGLQKQLSEMQKTLNGNQELLREVVRSVRGVNTLGRDVDAGRQVQLLRSFDTELRKQMAADHAKAQSQFANLADKLDALADQIAQDKRRPENGAANAGCIEWQAGRRPGRAGYCRGPATIEFDSSQT
jgi:ABC-type phosphate transport system auxiliary subunit